MLMCAKHPTATKVPCDRRESPLSQGTRISIPVNLSLRVGF